jgi:hypothetical protein
LDAVRKQLDAGYEIGPQHPLAGVVAKQICELTGFDRAALCNTGSEAVMGTVRVARTVTGRDTLVIFTGSYHGIFDEVIVRGTKKLRSVPAAPGILRNTSENVLVLDYGTPESLAIIRERAATIAAVLVEPVQSRRPDFQPREFLQELRAITPMPARCSSSTKWSPASARIRVVPRPCSASTPIWLLTARWSAAASRSASLRANASSWMRSTAVAGSSATNRFQPWASPISPAPSCVTRWRWPPRMPCSIT